MGRSFKTRGQCSDEFGTLVNSNRISYVFPGLRLVGKHVVDFLAVSCICVLLQIQTMQINVSREGQSTENSYTSIGDQKQARKLQATLEGCNPKL